MISISTKGIRIRILYWNILYSFTFIPFHLYIPFIAKLGHKSQKFDHTKKLNNIFPTFHVNLINFYFFSQFKIIELLKIQDKYLILFFLMFVLSLTKVLYILKDKLHYLQYYIDDFTKDNSKKYNLNYVIISQIKLI